MKSWWAVAESNCGHEAFQASALPTELTAHNFQALNYTFNFHTVKVCDRSIKISAPFRAQEGRIAASMFFQN
jgi:hypothetical protein